MRAFASTMFRLFLTGVLALLPFVVTVVIVGWVLRVADAYIGPSSHFGQFLLVIVGDTYKYPGYIVGYLVVVLLIILLGFLITRATVARVQKAIDSMLGRIPLFGKIYATVLQIVDLFGRKDQSSFEKFGGVGLARLGNMKMVALLTSQQRYPLDADHEYVLVYIPSSPMPATGFTVFLPVEDFEPLAIPVEDLAKLLMSLGLLGPQVLSQERLGFISGKGNHGRNSAQ